MRDALDKREIKLPGTHRVAAFSLVEVTLALGLVAFGLIVLLGLIPTGLEQVRASSAESVAVNILSELASGVRTSGTSNVSNRIPVLVGGTGQAYFDGQGRWLGTNAPSSEAVYAAKWTVRARNSIKGIPPNVYILINWPATSPQPNGLVEGTIALSYDPASP